MRRAGFAAAGALPGAYVLYAELVVLPADWKVRLFGRLDALDRALVAAVRATQAPYRLAPPAFWLALAFLASALVLRSRARGAPRAVPLLATLAAFVVVVTG